MLKVEQIVVGVDFRGNPPWDVESLSEPTRVAVRNAFELGSRVPCPVILVSVLPTIKAGWFESEDEARQTAEEYRREAERSLQAVHEKFRDTSAAPVDVKCVVATGKPWLELLRIVGHSPHSLLICGTRQPGLLRRMLIGSTGLRLLRNAPCPVWLAKPGAEDQDPVLNVLAATDLSEVGNDVVDFAIGLARLLPARLTIFHSVDDDLDRHIARTGVSAEKVEEYRRREREKAESQIHEYLATTDFRTLEHGVNVIVAEGPADVGILTAIDELGIELLIMGTAGRGGVAGALVGNTVEQLLPELSCSLLAIKPRGFESPVDLSDQKQS